MPDLRRTMGGLPRPAMQWWLWGNPVNSLTPVRYKVQPRGSMITIDVIYGLNCPARTLQQINNIDRRHHKYTVDFISFCSQAERIPLNGGVSNDGDDGTQ